MSDDVETKSDIVDEGPVPTCPECGEPILIHQGHCFTCDSCGWSMCGL